MAGRCYVHCPNDDENDGKWVKWSIYKSGVPKYAVSGGYDRNNNYYVIRAPHGCNEVVAGKYCEDTRQAYICYGGEEHVKEHFEILTHDNCHWVQGIGPCHTRIQGGWDSCGNKVYIIRAQHDNCLVIGKYHNGRAYIPYDTKEHVVTVFQSLHRNEN